MTSSTQQRVNTVLKNDLGLNWAMGIPIRNIIVAYIWHTVQS